MKVLSFLAIILLLSPTATAAITITVPDQEEHKTERTIVGSESYVFNLRNPPFNLTPMFGAYQNESLFAARLRTGIINDEAISSSTTYYFTIQYNDTHTYKATFYYEKHGWGIFSWWIRYITIERDGTILYQDENKEVKGEFKPNPEFYFDFALRGSYNSVTDCALNCVNVSGEVLYNNPSLFISYRDDYQSTAFPLIVKTFIALTGIGTDADGGFYDESTIEITSAPIVHVDTTDNTHSNQHSLKYRFTNKTVESSNVASFINEINQDRKNCPFSLFGLCVSALIGELIKGIFTIALSPIDWLFSGIPLYEAIKSATVQLFNGIASTYELILILTTADGPNFPTSGIFIALLIWSLCLGLLLFSMSGRFWHIIAVPYWQIKIWVMIVIALTYGLWIWLPMKGFELITRLIQNLRG